MGLVTELSSDLNATHSAFRILYCWLITAVGLG